MSINFEKLVFVVGCPRSGTTKLTELLNNHGQVFCSSETHFFNTNWGFDSVKDSFFEHYRIKDFIELTKIDTRKVIEISNALQNTGLGIKQALFSALMQATKENFPEKTVFCEKTPQHLQNVREILELFPEAKFIHIERDGRDVVNSLLKMPWRPAGLINNARFWRKYIKLGEEIKESFIEQGLKESFISIKFEELLAKPNETLESVCTFIGIPFSETMLEHNFDDSQKVFADWERQWKYKVNLDLDQSRKGAYKKELSLDDQIILNHFLRNDLEALDYEVDLSGFKFKHQIFILKSYIGLLKARLMRFISSEQ